MRQGRGRAQSIVEYCLFIAIIVGTLGAMKVYASRGLQGFLKKTADQLAPHKEAGMFYEKEQIPWVDDVNATDMTSKTRVTNMQKERLQGNERIQARASANENKFYGTSINYIGVQPAQEKYKNEFDRGTLNQYADSCEPSAAIADLARQKTAGCTTGVTAAGAACVADCKLQASVRKCTGVGDADNLVQMRTCVGACTGVCA